MLTDQEVETLCAPNTAFLPFGWAVAGLAESSKVAATMYHTSEALAQLYVALCFLALEHH